MYRSRSERRALNASTLRSSRETAECHIWGIASFVNRRRQVSLAEGMKTFPGREIMDHGSKRNWDAGARAVGATHKTHGREDGDIREGKAARQTQE